MCYRTPRPSSRTKRGNRLPLEGRRSGASQTRFDVCASAAMISDTLRICLRCKTEPAWIHTCGPRDYEKTGLAQSSWPSITYTFLNSVCKRMCMQLLRFFYEELFLRPSISASLLSKPQSHRPRANPDPKSKVHAQQARRFVYADLLRAAQVNHGFRQTLFQVQVLKPIQ